LSRTSAGRRANIIRPRKRFGSCWKACAARDGIAELCRREGIAQNLYYRWSKDFLEAGKKTPGWRYGPVRHSDEVRDLRREATALKEVVADLTLENRLLKKSVMADGEDGRMRYPASEKWRSSGSSSNPSAGSAGAGADRNPEIHVLSMCDLYWTGGPEALDDCSPRPDRAWNRIPDDVRARIVTLALDETELSPRELAVRFTDAERYFVSEASVYRLLKAHDLITSPAFIVMKALASSRTRRRRRTSSGRPTSLT